MPGDGTRSVRAGHPPPRQGEPFLPGPVLAGPFHLSGDPAGAEYLYGRYGNPTWRAYEDALGELEGGEVVLFASGMAAATAVLLAALDPAGALVLPSDCYMHVRGVAERYLAARGVPVRQIPTASMDPAAVPAEVDLLWLESPSNPGLDLCDVAALAAPRPDRPRLVALDNTFATPLGQRGLDLGVDLVVSSVTKHLSGHSDLLLGYVAARDAALATAIREWRKQTGAVPGPFEVWLAHRSLATLELRLERGCANALALGELLSARDDVHGVRYPGLPSDPAHALARRQMSRFGTVICFDLGSRARAEAFLESARLVDDATSFGGVRTTAERRGRWGGDAVPEGFVRLSAGCEDREDLVRDVREALQAASS